jgi:tetratricopeptide (TPR) repeat protein
VREADFEAMLLKGKSLVERCKWGPAQKLLADLARHRGAPATMTALFNLLGCCACLCQDFVEGVRCFTTAVRLAPNDGGIHQNLALAHEWMKDLAQAEPHWNRYFDILERRLAPSPSSPAGAAPLLYEGLHRLAGLYTEKEKWGVALMYIERAHRLRPDDTDTLERLFNLYNQVRRLEDARRVLQRLRLLKPGEAQFELYELDLVELREIDDIDRWVTSIGRVVQAHHGDPRVEERALSMIGNSIPLLSRTSDQLTEQLNKVMRQVRGLQNYQINWQAVHDVMRDLKRELQKLRRTIGKCLAVLTHPEHRRTLRSLGEHIDRKIDFCRQWQGN